MTAILVLLPLVQVAIAQSEIALKLHVETSDIGVRLLIYGSSQATPQALSIVANRLSVEHTKRRERGVWDFVPTDRVSNTYLLRDTNREKPGLPSGHPERFIYISAADDDSGSLVLVTDGLKAIRWQIFASGQERVVLKVADESKGPLYLGAGAKLSKEPIVLKWERVSG